MEKTLSPDTQKNFQEFLAKKPQSIQSIQKAALEKAVAIGYPKNKAEEFTFVPTSGFSSYLEEVPQSSAVSVEDTLPQGIKVLSLQEALTRKEESWDVQELQKTYAKNLAQEEDLHSAIAQASSSALFVYIPKGVSVEKAITLSSLSKITGNSVRQDTFVWIYADHGSNTIWNIESKESQVHQNHSYLVQLESKAKIQWVSYLCPLGGKEEVTSHHFDKVSVLLQEDSIFQGIAATALTHSNHLARTAIEAALLGEGSHFEWNSASVVSTKNQSHTYLNIHHAVPRATSKQCFKNVLAGSSRTSVDGTVHVHKDAQETEAEQLINNLMLSDNCKANNKPNLQIYADDVKCAHGATVGQLDADQLFYLQSRGFSLEQAKATLTSSYVEELIEKIDDNSLRTQIAENIANAMKVMVSGGS
jgi:Fe-S cluster assembly protein SufD